LGTAEGSGRASRAKSAANKKKEVLSIAFVKKYIQYAKARPAPVLTRGAADWIVNVYARLRNEETEGNQKRVGATTSFTLFR
jgi:DNA replication licensing factor MCM3